MLSNYINSDYIRAANTLAGKHARRKIVVYVESFEDVFFWSNLLRSLETPQLYFEVMLPSKTSLCKGKKIALANRLGPNMIACVDADYDYMMQGTTETSHDVCFNPYVFHTIVYAIESYYCYAPSLQNACVMATLNDRRIFDFEAFLLEFSETVWPLFVWSVWAYKYGLYKTFSLADFYKVVRLREVNLHHPEHELSALRKRVNAKVSRLQRQFPEGRKTYKPLQQQLIDLGISPAMTYLFMRGHDLQDGVVLPVAEKVCDMLRKEREREIRLLAEHDRQMQNEQAAYQHTARPIAEVIGRHGGYDECPFYAIVQQQIQQFIDKYHHFEQQTIDEEKYPKHNDATGTVDVQPADDGAAHRGGA